MLGLQQPEIIALFPFSFTPICLAKHMVYQFDLRDSVVMGVSLPVGSGQYADFLLVYPTTACLQWRLLNSNPYAYTVNEENARVF